ncbi:hypothetical protein D3C72_1502230 [compost metagenome]
MALDDIEEGTFEGILIHGIAEIEREGNVEDFAETEGGIGLPERHLRQRKRRSQRAVRSSLGLRGRRGFKPGRLFCERGGGRVAEEIVEAQLDAVIGEKTPDDAGGDQRMAAEIEEIVIRSHVGRDERFTEFGKDCRGGVVVLTGSGGRKGCLFRCCRGVLRDDAGKIRAAFKMADEALQQEGRRMWRCLLATRQF